MNQANLLPVYSHAVLEQNIKVLSACYEAGLRRFEFTNRHETAQQHFKSLIHIVNNEMKDLDLGVGTIMNTKDAEIFVSLGAHFLVSPLISNDLIEFTSKHKIEWIPGCATGAEIGLAYNSGIDLVKLYPIKQLGGPDYIKAIKGPFYKTKFQASGGIKGDKSEIEALLQAGASIVGLGNSFFNEDMTKEEISAKIKALLD